MPSIEAPQLVGLYQIGRRGFRSMSKIVSKTTIGLMRFELKNNIRGYESFFGGSPETLPNKFDISCQAILLAVFLALFTLYKSEAIWFALLCFFLVAFLSPVSSKLKVRNSVRWFLNMKKKLEDSDDPDKKELLSEIDSVMSEYRGYMRVVQMSDQETTNQATTEQTTDQTVRHVNR